MTVGTLFYEAALNGWKDDSTKLEPIHNVIQSSNNPTVCISNEKAARIWEDCIPAPPQHNYIHRKLGRNDGLKVYPYGAPELIILGRSVYGYLIVPCWSNSNLQTLQFIPPEKGDKLNLPDASFGDGYFMVGQVKNIIYICEGLGQAWAVNITGDAAAVCFGAGRMMWVAKKLRNEYPSVLLIVVSDRGKEEQSIDIAKAVNGMFVHMPGDKPKNYDINDYLKDYGEESLKSFLEKAKKLNVEEKGSTTGQNLSNCDALHDANKPRPLTELGNAWRMFDTNRDTVKYIPDMKKWIVWNGSSWKWDDGSTVRSIASKLPFKIYLEGATYLGDSEIFEKWAKKSQELRIMNASITLLSDFPEVRQSLSSIDSNSFLVGFNEARDVIDLKTGISRASLPSDYVTKSLAATVIGDASKAIRWAQFLEQIFEGDYEVIEWIQRFCGYLLTGSTQEQIFLFCFGYGANGKSVFSELLKEVMGDYGVVIPWETLSESRRQAGSATPDLATLIGKRFGICSETEDNRELAEGLVKGVVSGDSMTVRPLYAPPIEFKPNCKLVITGNHKPIIRGNDNGIWRRVRLVPFNRTFSPEDRDPHLLMKLKDEVPHILAWMVQGCLEWQKRGLADTPKIIRAATDCYQSDQDIIGTWLSERAAIAINGEVLSAELYRNYSGWCSDNGLRATSAVVFGRRLAERGFKVRQSNGKRLWSGLSLNRYS